MRPDARAATAKARRGRQQWWWYDDGMLDPGLLAPEEIRPLARAEYDRLVDLGFFEDERVELLRGALVRMSPQGAPHANAPARLMARLILALGGRAHVRAHSPLALDDWSEPEPDIAVVLPGDYSRAHPTTALLVRRGGGLVAAKRPPHQGRALRGARHPGVLDHQPRRGCRRSAHVTRGRPVHERDHSRCRRAVVPRGISGCLCGRERAVFVTKVATRGP